MTFPIDTPKLLLFALTFILFTPIGTLSHEYGHIGVAQYLGYETTLHYGSMNYHPSKLSQQRHDLYWKNRPAVLNEEAFEDQALIEAIGAQMEENSWWISFGGPLQTMLTGTIGFLVLLFREEKIRQNGLQWIDWLFVFLSLFWLREVFNPVVYIGRKLFFGGDSCFGGDEQRLSLGLDVWEGTLSVAFGLMGLAVVLYIIFRILHKQLRLTFIIAGMLGGTLGFYLWMSWIGPIVLP